MASFRVTTTEPAPHLGNGKDQVLSLQPLQHQEGMLYKVWTVCSDKKIETLNLNLPGVVFIDYDANLGSSSTPAGPPSTDDPESDASNDGEARAQDVGSSRVVAKIVVTSDSSDLLKGLELVPLDVDQADEGFKFRVKNETTELKGAILTQVFVSDKNALQEFYGRTAQFVLGDAVLVQQDHNAAVNVSVFNSGSLYLSSKEGFSLRSFNAMIDGSGIYQLQAPSFDLQEGLSLATLGPCTLAITANAIKAKRIGIMAMMNRGEIVMCASKLRAKSIFSNVFYRGRISFVGNGEVKMHRAMILTSGEINVGGIVSEKAHVVTGWSGHVVVSALKELQAINPLFGTVEYTNTKPEDITDSSWLWWKKKKTPSKIVTPAATSAESNKTTAKSYEFCEPPLRQPVPIHHRVKKCKRDEPELVRPDSWASRYSKLGFLTGVVAVGAVVVIASQRKTARLN